MMTSVTFKEEIVTVRTIPRIGNDEIRDYFYSQAEIDRFHRIWKNVAIELARRKELKRRDCKAGTKRKHAETEESTADALISINVGAAKRKCTMASADAQPDELTTVRIVSPETTTEEQSSVCPDRISD